MIKLLRVHLFSILLCGIFWPFHLWYVKKVDVFLLIEKQQWTTFIAHLTGLKLQGILMSFVIWRLVVLYSSNAFYKLATFLILLFYVIRIIEYYTYRGSIEFMGVMLFFYIMVNIVIFIGCQKK